MTSDDPQRWFIIGTGRVGRALGTRLEVHGVPVAGSTRTEATAARVPPSWRDRVQVGEVTAISPGVTHVLIAVPDRSIVDAVASLPIEVRHHEPRIWLHTCGSIPGEQLRVADVAGPVGSCHPLCSVSGGEDDEQLLRGAFFAIDGDPDALEAARALVELCGGVAGVVPSDARVAYHLAAVLASNGIYALFEAISRVTEASGLEGDALQRGLETLAAGSLSNLRLRGVTDAATGPAVRGDVETIGEHLRWIRDAAASIEPFYHALTEQLAGVAARRGVDERALRRALERDGDEPPAWTE